jgi:hypothetical protein
MERLSSALVEVETCLREVLLNLRQQQALASRLERIRKLYLKLLSASLRTFAAVEAKRRRI